MARVSFVEMDDASPVGKAMYKKAEERFEMLLNIFKVMGHAPELMTPFCDFIMEILQDGLVDWKTKELLILKSTLLNECHYCVVQHETLSKRLGIPDEKIADLAGDNCKTSPRPTSWSASSATCCMSSWSPSSTASSRCCSTPPNRARMIRGYCPLNRDRPDVRRNHRWCLRTRHNTARSARWTLCV